MQKFRTNNVNDTELVYSILREQYPNRQIEIEFNDNTKEYFISLTNKPYKQDPEVPVDLNIKVVYGDSVTGDTPLLLKKNNLVYIETISSIFDESKKQEYPGFKIFDKTVRLEKEYSTSDYQIWSDIGWVDIKRVIRHKCDKKIYRVLTHTGCVDVTEDHSLINSDLKPIKPIDLKIGDQLLHSFPKEFNEIDQKEIYQKENYQMLPNYILNAPKEIRLDYWKKMSSYGDRIKGKINAQRMYYLMRSLGFDIDIDIFDSTQEIYLLKTTNFKNTETIVKKIIEHEPRNDFVYDIETTIGRFAGGIGQLQLKNTDSIFVKFKYNRDDFERNRIDTFRLATVCGDNLTQDIFKRPPIELEFEKVFHPFVLLTKKRYIANKYENPKDPFQLKCVDAKGIALTRRDYCPMVKKCYKQVIDTILNDKTSTGESEMKNDGSKDSVERSTDVYKQFIDDIYNHKIKIDDLVVSAMLASSYKTRPVHVQLAERLKERKEEVQIGDRIPYIYIESNDPKQQKSELGEDPKYAIQHNLKYNRSCYLEQLAKPLLGFYKIVLKDREDLLDEIINYTNETLVKCGGKPLKPSDFKIDD
jgi:hypothetical protein